MKRNGKGRRASLGDAGHFLCPGRGRVTFSAHFNEGDFADALDDDGCTNEMPAPSRSVSP